MNDRNTPGDDLGPIPLTLVERALATPVAARSGGSVGPWPYLACPGDGGSASRASTGTEQHDLAQDTNPEMEEDG